MSPWRERRGVSEVVGTILIIGVVIVAMSVIAGIVLRERGPRERFVTFDVTVENTADVRVVRLIIRHVGGETIGSPAKYLSVHGHEERFTWMDNRAYNGFSGLGKFEMGDNAVMFIRHDNANVVPGNYFQVRILDNYTDPGKVHYEGVLRVQRG